MNWNPFNRKKKTDDLAVTKERLLRWREELLQSAYAMRVLDKVSGHLLWNPSGDNLEVRKLLGGMVVDQLMNQSKMWGTIGDIEYILLMKHGVNVMDSMSFQDLQITQLELDINQAAEKDRKIRAAQPVMPYSVEPQQEHDEIMREITGHDSY